MALKAVAACTDTGLDGAKSFVLIGTAAFSALVCRYRMDCNDEASQPEPLEDPSRDRLEASGAMPVAPGGLVGSHQAFAVLLTTDAEKVVRWL